MLEQRLATGPAAIGMHVVHQLGTTVPRLVGQRVEVADDEVGLQAHLEESIGTTVDTDQHGMELADVGPERPQVFAVVVAAHDHERVAATEDRAQLGSLQGLEGEVRFLLDVLERVHREEFELVADRGARRS